MSVAIAQNDSAEMQALFDSIAASRRSASSGAMLECAKTSVTTSVDLVRKIGQLTRTLHDSLRALGYDKMVEEAASSIPDARERLSYVATLTERAAQRVLNAAEVAKPLQDSLSANASGLAQRWRGVFGAQASVEEFKALARSTLTFLEQVPASTKATNEQLLEIVMAQDFQDLTGQVIKRITDLAHQCERQLLTLLLESTPAEHRPPGADTLLNGPVVNAGRAGEVVQSQAQVDDLLESLGF